MRADEYYLDFEESIKELEKKVTELTEAASIEGIDFSQEIIPFQKKLEEVKKEIYSNLSPWQRTQVARHPQRPSMSDYIRLLFTDWIELRGDRRYKDDPAITGGIGYFDNEAVVAIGHQKGKDIKTNIYHNFGMPNPEGYRKALRLMKLSEKFHRPLLTFIDTPGAYPGIGAEERGQASAIATNLYTASNLRTPIIVVIAGEGGSGGALAIGVGDRILMLENAIYSVISPEGCAAILWKDKTKVEEAATTLRLTANDLLELGVIDEIIPEPLGGAHRNYETTTKMVKDVVKKHLRELKRMSLEKLINQRYEKFRQMGKFITDVPALNSCNSL